MQTWRGKVIILEQWFSELRALAGAVQRISDKPILGLSPKMRVAWMPRHDAHHLQRALQVEIGSGAAALAPDLAEQTRLSHREGRSKSGPGPPHLAHRQVAGKEPEALRKGRRPMGKSVWRKARPTLERTPNATGGPGAVPQ